MDSLRKTKTKSFKSIALAKKVDDLKKDITPKKTWRRVVRAVSDLEKMKVEKMGDSEKGLRRGG